MNESTRNETPSSIVRLRRIGGVPAGSAALVTRSSVEKHALSEASLPLGGFRLRRDRLRLEEKELVARSISRFFHRRGRPRPAAVFTQESVVARPF